MEALVDECKNPDEYRFECGEDIGSPIRKMKEELKEYYRSLKNRILKNSEKRKEFEKKDLKNRIRK